MSEMYLVGGATRTGKSTVLRRLLASRPALAASTDSIRAIARGLVNPTANPALFQVAGEAFFSTLRRLGPAETVELQNTESRSFWPSIVTYLQSNTFEGEPVALEGCALLPDLIDQLDLRARVVHLVCLVDQSAAIIDHARRDAGDWLHPRSTSELELFVQFNRALNQYFYDEACHFGPEIIAGDTSPLGKSGNGSDGHAYNPEVQARRHRSEQAAARTIFNKLDPVQASDLYDVWIEIETLASYEAKVVKSLDKIEAMLQVLEYRDGRMFKEHLEFTISYGRKGSDVDPAIAEFADLVAGQLQAKFREFKLDT